MFKTILIGWFILRSHELRLDKHNYLMEDPANGFKVLVSTDTPYPYEENTWINLEMSVSCLESSEPYTIKDVAGTFSRQVNICAAEKVKELKCSESNSFIVNDIAYCE